MANTYSSLSPRQTVYAAEEFLKRALPLLTIEKFCSTKPLPANQSKTISFRRYFVKNGTGAYSGTAGVYNLPISTTALTEGVTKAAIDMDKVDVTATLAQYGDWTTFTDVILDTHEDVPGVIREFSDALGEQAALTKETLLFNLLASGTNVFYANGSARNAVNTAVSLTMLRRISRAFRNQNVMPITQVVSSTTSYGTQNVAAAFVGLCHPNAINDLRGIAGFIPVEQYQQSAVMEGEIGKIEDFRFIASTVMAAWEDAGGLAGSTVLSTSGTNADVYPIIFMGKGACTVVPLRGGRSAQNMQVNVKNPEVTETDPHAQRGIISYKFWHAACVTNPFALIRGEVAATV